MKTWSILGLFTTLGLVAFAAEIKINIQDLPPAVQRAMKAQTNGATILGASKEREDRRMTYEVEMRLNNKSRNLTFAEDGALLEVEEVNLDSIPPRAKEAIQKRVGDGTIKRVESVTHGPHVSYEADQIKVRSHDRSISTSGRISAALEERQRAGKPVIDARL